MREDEKTIKIDELMDKIEQIFKKYVKRYEIENSIREAFESKTVFEIEKMKANFLKALVVYFSIDKTLIPNPEDEDAVTTFGFDSGYFWIISGANKLIYSQKKKQDREYGFDFDIYSKETADKIDVILRLLITIWDEDSDDLTWKKELSISEMNTKEAIFSGVVEAIEWVKQTQEKITMIDY